MSLDIPFLSPEAKNYLLLLAETITEEAARKAIEQWEAKQGDAEDDRPQLLTKSEAAQFLRISIPTLDKWRSDGLVPTKIIGLHTPRFLRSDLESLIQSEELTN